ncbi:hypothetical protein PAPYR_1365 [Paratrimastix pyriformis]|uniref:TmcB/TmcC TPR repeats domain-containing protein n=1 Tax=Paratrimastix pyriformis TaxID=342808 RepID=A0ABQ8UZF1_9EUKA|nr:hypothetical protein PAPYR_1365 [Paratrimastix pyriformis]
MSRASIGSRIRGEGSLSSLKSMGRDVAASTILQRFEKGYWDIGTLMMKGNTSFKYVSQVFTFIEILQLFSFVFYPAFEWDTYLYKFEEYFLSYVGFRGLLHLSLTSWLVVLSVVLAAVLTVLLITTSLAYILQKGEIVKRMWVVSFLRGMVLCIISIANIPIFTTLGGTLASLWTPSVLADAQSPGLQYSLASTSAFFLVLHAGFAIIMCYALNESSYTADGLFTRLHSRSSVYNLVLEMILVTVFTLAPGERVLLKIVALVLSILMLLNMLVFQPFYRRPTNMLWTGTFAALLWSTILLQFVQMDPGPVTILCLAGLVPAFLGGMALSAYRLRQDTIFAATPFWTRADTTCPLPLALTQLRPRFFLQDFTTFVTQLQLSDQVAASRGRRGSLAGSLSPPSSPGPSGSLSLSGPATGGVIHRAIQSAVVASPLPTRVGATDPGFPFPRVRWVFQAEIMLRAMVQYRNALVRRDKVLMFSKRYPAGTALLASVTRQQLKGGGRPGFEAAPNPSMPLDGHLPVPCRLVPCGKLTGLGGSSPNRVTDQPSPSDVEVAAVDSMIEYFFSYVTFCFPQHPLVVLMRTNFLLTVQNNVNEALIAHRQLDGTEIPLYLRPLSNRLISTLRSSQSTDTNSMSFLQGMAFEQDYKLAERSRDIVRAQLTQFWKLIRRCLKQHEGHVSSLPSPRWVLPDPTGAKGTAKADEAAGAQGGAAGRPERDEGKDKSLSVHHSNILRMLPQIQGNLIEHLDAIIAHTEQANLRYAKLLQRATPRVLRSYAVFLELVYRVPEQARDYIELAEELEQESSSKPIAVVAYEPSRATDRTRLGITEGGAVAAVDEHALTTVPTRAQVGGEAGPDDQRARGSAWGEDSEDEDGAVETTQLAGPRRWLMRSLLLVGLLLVILAVAVAPISAYLFQTVDSEVLLSNIAGAIRSDAALPAAPPAPHQAGAALSPSLPRVHCPGAGVCARRKYSCGSVVGCLDLLERNSTHTLDTFLRPYAPRPRASANPAIPPHPAPPPPHLTGLFASPIRPPSRGLAWYDRSTQVLLFKLNEEVLPMYAAQTDVLNRRLAGLSNASLSSTVIFKGTPNYFFANRPVTMWQNNGTLLQMTAKEALDTVLFCLRRLPMLLQQRPDVPLDQQPEWATVMHNVGPVNDMLEDMYLAWVDQVIGQMELMGWAFVGAFAAITVLGLLFLQLERTIRADAAQNMTRHLVHLVGIVGVTQATRAAAKEAEKKAKEKRVRIQAREDKPSPTEADPPSPAESALAPHQSFASYLEGTPGSVPPLLHNLMAISEAMPPEGGLLAQITQTPAVQRAPGATPATSSHNTALLPGADATAILPPAAEAPEGEADLSTLIPAPPAPLETTLPPGEEPPTPASADTDDRSGQTGDEGGSMMAPPALSDQEEETDVAAPGVTTVLGPLLDNLPVASSSTPHIAPSSRRGLRYRQRSAQSIGGPLPGSARSARSAQDPGSSRSGLSGAPLMAAPPLQEEGGGTEDDDEVIDAERQAAMPLHQAHHQKGVHASNRAARTALAELHRAEDHLARHASLLRCSRGELMIQLIVHALAISLMVLPPVLMVTQIFADRDLVDVGALSEIRLNRMTDVAVETRLLEHQWRYAAHPDPALYQSIQAALISSAEGLVKSHKDILYGSSMDAYSVFTSGNQILFDAHYAPGCLNCVPELCGLGPYDNLTSQSYNFAVEEYVRRANRLAATAPLSPDPDDLAFIDTTWWLDLEGRGLLIKGYIRNVIVNAVAWTMTLSIVTPIAVFVVPFVGMSLWVILRSRRDGKRLSQIRFLTTQAAVPREEPSPSPNKQQKQALRLRPAASTVSQATAVA